ncbi:hypothetical protein [Rhodococcoides yunnanense]|uniref:Uncharacterized protein n=1 Tax=Rhodococcoides yunnanense TaxID=278209 RepID=A0ABU4B698_9NOCA|nr:hypothetical protein [Rhodococcus yunnanensis]MDV6259717.1 hypothetical protein [Rhodococcus yunnanensis]
MSATDGFAPVRGASVGTLSALVTATAHTFGGGMFPSDAALVLLVLVCAAVGYATAVAPRAVVSTAVAPRAQLLVVLATAQAIGHLLLTAVDGHHHGSITQQMLAAHAVAVLVGALAIRGAEHGIRRAVTSLRRALPLLTALVVDDNRIAPPLPVYRIPGSTLLLDLSGCGNRGPPVRTA